MPRFGGTLLEDQPALTGQSKGPRFGGTLIEDEPEQAGISTTGNITSGLNEGLARTLGLPVDAVASAVNQTISNFGGDFQITDPVGGSQFFENVLTNLGMVGGDPTTESGRVLRRTAQEVGAAVMPGLGMASKAAAPIKFAAGEAGLAATGGVAAGVTEEAGGGVGAQLAAQAITPLSVSGIAAGAKGAVRKIARGGEAGRKTVEDTIATFKDVGDFPTVGQATQNRVMQGIETVSSKFPGGGKRFYDKATQSINNIQNKVNQISDDLSRGADPEKAGRAIKSSVEGFVGDFKGKAGLLYNKLDEIIPKDSEVSVGKTKTLLDDLAKPIPGAERTSTRLVNPVIRRLQQDIGKDAADGTLPYGALKAIRTRIGEKLTSNDLVSDVPKAQLKRLYGAISEDMKDAAKSVGGESAWRRADKYWKAGLSRIDDFLEPLAKKVQPEDIFLNATRGREGATRIRAVMKGLKPNEKNTVVAAVLKRMGRARAGSQDELSEVFSTETFLTNWNNMSPQARSAMFGGTTKLNRYAKDISQIAKATRIIRESSKALANPSGTAGQGVNLAALGAAGGAVSGLIDPKLIMAAGVAVVSNNAAARLMTSPTFVKFLADTTRFPVSRLPNLMTRLSGEISKEHVQLQQDVQEYLRKTGGNQSQ